jgi:hypothetical protein
MEQRPLYGALVIGELPHDSGQRTPPSGQTPPAPAPAGSRIKRSLHRWVRALHSTLTRSN